MWRLWGLSVAALLLSVPELVAMSQMGMGETLFSVITPGTHLRPHCGACCVAPCPACSPLASTCSQNHQSSSTVLANPTALFENALESFAFDHVSRGPLTVYWAHMLVLFRVLRLYV